MARNPKPPGHSAGNTFKREEIEGLLGVLAAIQRGAHTKDVQRLAKSEPVVALQRKFLRMRESIERQLAEANRCTSRDSGGAQCERPAGHEGGHAAKRAADAHERGTHRRMRENDARKAKADEMLAAVASKLKKPSQ